MSQVCAITGKSVQSGNRVSHANNKTRRRFLPNLHQKRIWDDVNKRWVKLRLCQKALRAIDKFGLQAVLDKQSH